MSEWGDSRECHSGAHSGGHSREGCHSGAHSGVHGREGCQSGVTVGSVTVGLTVEATVGRGVTVGLSGGDSR